MAGVRGRREDGRLVESIVEAKQLLVVYDFVGVGEVDDKDDCLDRLRSGFLLSGQSCRKIGWESESRRGCYCRVTGLSTIPLCLLDQAVRLRAVLACRGGEDRAVRSDEKTTLERHRAACSHGGPENGGIGFSVRGEARRGVGCVWVGRDIDQSASTADQSGYQAPVVSASVGWLRRRGKSQTRMAFVGLEKLLKPSAVVRRRWPKVKGEER